jgi:hypothetical protein
MADRTLELRLLQQSLTQSQRDLAPRPTPSHDRADSQRLYRRNQTPTTRRNGQCTWAQSKAFLEYIYFANATLRVPILFFNDKGKLVS